MRYDFFLGGEGSWDTSLGDMGWVDQFINHWLTMSLNIIKILDTIHHFYKYISDIDH